MTFKILIQKAEVSLKRIPKSLRFPIILLIPIVILCALGINISSIGTFSEAIDGNAGSNRIFGQNSWIRSDEYLATAPILLSQDENGNPKVNEDIGTGIDLGIQANVPTKSIFSLFKPPVWMFIISDSPDVGFAFYWWIQIYILIIGTYFFILELTKKNYPLAIIGSLIFFFTPFVQWWTSFILIGYASMIGFCLLRILKASKKLEIVIMATLFYFFSIAFALILYPPFQIVLIWSCVFVVLGYLFNNFKDISHSLLLKFKIINISIAFFLILITLFLFVLDQQNTVEIMTHTVYPGVRSYLGGGLSITQLFNGFYNILLQSDFNGVPLGQRNQSEASSFFLYSPAIIIFYLIAFLKNIKNLKKPDYILIFLSLWIILLSLFSLIPFPEWFGKYTFLSMVPPFRTIIGIGFTSYVLTFYFLSSKKIPLSENIILPIFISLCVGIMTYLMGITFYNGNAEFFSKPEILSPIIKIVLISAFSFASTYLLLRKHKLLFISSLLIFSVASTIFVNPLYKGIGSIDETDFAKTINKYISSPEKKWVVYGDHRFAQYLLANGQSVLNGIHYYPLFDMWEVIDPEKKYIEIYNRYAHIHFSDTENSKDLIELIYADQINVNIDPCDNKLRELNVELFLLTEKTDYTCLIYRESVNTYLRGDLYIYERK